MGTVLSKPESVVILAEAPVDRGLPRYRAFLKEIGDFY